MIVTIHQPEYLPWISFFDRVQKSDVLVILDNVGYQKNGFINRNKIKTRSTSSGQAGWTWLTIPVLGRSPNKKINEIFIDNTSGWQQKHLSLLRENYSLSDYFNNYYGFLEETFSKKWDKISELDIYLIENIVDFLGLKTKIKIASSMNIEGQLTERLVEICRSLGADTYLSGPGGKDYMDLKLFEGENIRVIFQDLISPTYNQQFMENGFLPGMSIIDLLFNHGEKSINFFK